MGICEIDPRDLLFIFYIDYYILQLTERFINHKAIFEGI